jgi:hypothetical protein
MPIHDWTRVGAGTFHAFHTRWITHVGDALNKGLLPPGYYSDPEQHLGREVADVLTSHASDPGRVRSAPAPSPARLRRTLTVRHTSGRRIVALIEVLSPGNKASGYDVEQLVRKALEALASGVHLAVIDLLPPPGASTPRGFTGRSRARCRASGTNSRREGP